MRGHAWRGLTTASLASGELWGGRGRGQVVHGGRGGVCLGVGVRVLGVGVQQAGEGHPASGLALAGALEGVSDPAELPPHLIHLLLTHTHTQMHTPTHTRTQTQYMLAGLMWFQYY